MATRFARGDWGYIAYTCRMQGAKRGRALRPAIIASVMALPATAAAADSTHLAEPVAVTFRTSEGRDVHGEVQSWDLAAVYGTFGRIEWRQLEVAEAWHVYAAIIDPDIAEHWLGVGRVLSQLEGGQVFAERALRWAAWLGRYTADTAEQLLAELPPTPAGFVPPRPHVHRDDDGPFEPWPAMTEQEQAEATAQLKSKMQALLAALGLTMLLYEQPQMLVYSDMPAEEVGSLLIGLRATNLTLLKSFGLAPDYNVFWGKLVVVICNEQETFARINRQSFSSNTPPGMAGVHIPRGPTGYLLLWNYPDRLKLQATVPHELTHAFLHRYRSPARLPLWLDEGFADFVASLVLEDSPIDEARRSRGEWFFRNDGPVENVLDMQCMHDGWPGPYQAAYGVSYLLVREMFDENSARALACITAIVDGKPWEKALDEDFGLTREQLVERVKLQIGHLPNPSGAADSRPDR